MLKRTSQPRQRPIAWHARDFQQVLADLRTSPEGLSEQAAHRAMTEFGPNLLPPPKKRGPLRRFLAQFHNILIYVLLATAIVTGLLEHWVDTYVILAVVLVNAVIGFVQEGKAEKALDAIRDMLAPHASVVRDGRRRTIPADQLVPGDVVLLEPGDKVPADLRVLKAKNLRIQEAILTGESVAVEKSAEAVDEAAAIGALRTRAETEDAVPEAEG